MFWLKYVKSHLRYYFEITRPLVNQWRKISNSSPLKRERKLQNNYGCPVVFINKLCEMKNKIFNTLYIKIYICAKIQNHMVFEVL